MERTLSQNEAKVVLNLEWRKQKTVTLAELRDFDSVNVEMDFEAGDEEVETDAATDTASNTSEDETDESAEQDEVAEPDAAELPDDSVTRH